MGDLTKERKDDLIKKKEVRCLWPLLLISNNLILPHYQDKHHELKVLRDMTKEDLWRKDLTEFLEKLEEVERKGEQVELRLEDELCSVKSRLAAKEEVGRLLKTSSLIVFTGTC